MECGIDFWLIFWLSPNRLLNAPVKAFLFHSPDFRPVVLLVSFWRRGRGCSLLFVIDPFGERRTQRVAVAAMGLAPWRTNASSKVRPTASASAAYHHEDTPSFSFPMTEFLDRDFHLLRIPVVARARNRDYYAASRTGASVNHREDILSSSHETIPPAPPSVDDDRLRRREARDAKKTD